MTTSDLPEDLEERRDQVLDEFAQRIQWKARENPFHIPEGDVLAGMPQDGGWTLPKSIAGTYNEVYVKDILKKLEKEGLVEKEARRPKARGAYHRYNVWRLTPAGMERVKSGG